MTDPSVIKSYPDCFFLSNIGQPKFNPAEHYGSDDVFFDLRINQLSELEVVRRQGIGELFCVFSYPLQSDTDTIALQYWLLQSIDKNPSKAPYEGGTTEAFPMRGKHMTEVSPKLLKRAQFQSWKPQYFNSKMKFNQFSLAVPSWIQEEHGGIVYRRKTEK